MEREMSCVLDEISAFPASLEPCEWHCEWEDESLSNEESMQKMLAFLINFKDSCKNLPYNMRVHFNEDGSFEKNVEIVDENAITVLLPDAEKLREPSMRLATLFAKNFIKNSAGGGTLRPVLAEKFFRKADYKMAIWIDDGGFGFPLELPRRASRTLAFDQKGRPVFIFDADWLKRLDDDEESLVAGLEGVWEEYQRRIA